MVPGGWSLSASVSTVLADDYASIGVGVGAAGLAPAQAGGPVLRRLRRPERAVGWASVSCR